MKRALAGSLSLMLLASASLAAQSTPDRTLGALLGFSFAKATGADAEGSKVLTGVAVGGFATLGLAKAFAIEPQLLLVEKGLKGADEGSGATASVKISYLQVPLLLKGRFALSPSLSGFVYAGPAVAFRVGCRINLKSAGTELNTGCDDSANDIRTLDTSIIAGIGAEIGRGTLSVRYDRGLSKIDASAEGGDLKNSAILVLLGLKFGPATRD